MSLIDKLRKSREFQVPAGSHTFTVRRPTDADVALLRSPAPLDFVNRFVIGWDLKELDVIPGGGPDAVAFDALLWSEWVADRPQLWEPLAEAILGAYKTHAEAREVDAKN